MKAVPKTILAVLILSCVLGCSSTDARNVTQEVTITDKGAVVPNPVSTSVSINSHSISYSKAQSGAMIGGWSKQIQSPDFAAVWKIIEDDRLYESGNVLPPAGGTPCMGSQGMTIAIYREGSVHSFDISGGVLCNRAQWPAGVRNLVELEESLVNKYQQ